jgi:hypothetical protein
MREFSYRQPRMMTSFRVEFCVGDDCFHGFCRDISERGIRAEFVDPLIQGSSGLLILRPRIGVLEVRSQVAYVEDDHAGLLFVFQTPMERKMTAEFIAGILKDSGPPPVLSLT